MPRDVLEEILSAALREGAMAAESIPAFAAGLKDRARVILDERLRPVQDRVATLEKENAWRASVILGLTEENQRVRDEIDPLLDENRRLKDENQRVKDENARVRQEHANLLDERERLRDESRRLQDEGRRLQDEMEGVRAEWRTASEAHDRLLGHHRSVVRSAAESVLEVSALSVWRRSQARARLIDLAAALGRDTA